MPKVNSDQIRDKAVHTNHLADDITLGSGNQETAARQEAMTLHIGANDPHGDRNHVLPLWSKFYPPQYNQYYFPCTPFATTTISTGQVLNRMYLTPMFAAEDTNISWTALEVASTSGAGALHRVGFYIIDDQSNPFAWSIGVRWASLWGETSPTYDCSTTGSKERQINAFTGLYKDTWYAVADVGQVTAHQVIRGYGAPGATSPLGDAGGGDFTVWTQQPFQSLYVDGISGGLPAAAIPLDGSDIGSCVALWTAP